MLLSDFRTSISSEIGLDNTASSAEQALMDGWVNRGVVDVLRKTKCYVKPDDMTLTAGDADYTLSTSILEMIALDFQAATDGQKWGLQRVHLNEILERRRLNVSLSGVSPMYYAVSGSSTLSLYPTPSSADTLTAWYVPRPTKLANASDDPSTTTYGGIPEEYHDAIETYALYRAARYDDDSSSGGGQAYFQEYQRRVREIRREIARMGGGKVAKIRITRGSKGRRNLGFPPGYDVMR